METDQSRRSNVALFNCSKRQMKNPILVDLLKYWERLRAGRIAPMRSEINPREIESVLEHAFILEKIATDNIRFRLAGAELCNLMGMEVRGMAATAIIEVSHRAEYATVVSDIFSTPEIVEFELAHTRPVLAPLRADMLLLPMKNDLGQIQRILGAVVTDGPMGTPPHRFSITSKKVTRIVAAEAGEKRGLLPGFAEDSPRFSGQNPATETKPGQPYLRLVKSDD